MARIDVTNKIKSIYVNELEFTSKDTGEIIGYSQLEFEVVIDGEDDILKFKAPQNDKSAYRVLKLADDVE